MKKLITKRLIKKVITEIEKTEYWDARVLRLESLYFMDILWILLFLSMSMMKSIM